MTPEPGAPQPEREAPLTHRIALTYARDQAHASPHPEAHPQGEPDIRFYERLLTDGGLHVVRAVDGIITDQWLLPGDGHAVDTIHGRPGWIGQSVKLLRGKGYRRVRGEHRVDLSRLTSEE